MKIGKAAIAMLLAFGAIFAVAVPANAVVYSGCSRIQANTCWLDFSHPSAGNVNYSVNMTGTSTTTWTAYVRDTNFNLICSTTFRPVDPAKNFSCNTPAGDFYFYTGYQNSPQLVVQF